MVKRYQPGVYQVLAGQYECEMSDDDAGDYVLHSDYAALERLHGELVEAVMWEMECGNTRHWSLWDDAPRAAILEMAVTRTAARAAVGRLIGGE